MASSDPRFDSSPPHSSPSSSHSTMQEQNLSDNESMAMSVESTPQYSPLSPSPRPLRRPSPGVELPIRKRRHTSTGESDYQSTNIKNHKSSPRADLLEPRRNVDVHHTVDSSRLRQIANPVETSPASPSSLAVIASPLSKRAQKRARGTPLQTIQGQMRRLQTILDKIGIMSPVHANASQTWSALQKRLKQLQEGLVNPHEDINQCFLEEAHELESQAETFIEHNEASFGTSESAPNDVGSSDTNTDGGDSMTWKSRPLISSATSDDDQLFKRRNLFSVGSCSADQGSRHVSYASTGPTSIFTCRTASALIAPESEIEDFLSDLSDSIQASTLQNLCPDNMRGTFCHEPNECHSQGRFFACPEYAILKKCPHEKSDSLTHFGYKHTINGCTAHHKTDCKRKHHEGRSCRIEVVYFHVRASCITLRGGKKCQMKPCRWGHDFDAIRRTVMKK